MNCMQRAPNLQVFGQSGPVTRITTSGPMGSQVPRMSVQTGQNAWTSSPFANRNRFDVLASDDEAPRSEDECISTGSRSTRASRIRRREQSTEEHGRQNGRREQPSSEWQQAGPRRRRGSRLLIGRSHWSGGAISAARKWVERVPRTTLYVDNLSVTCSEDDLWSFVFDLGANVISCFKTVPRHRRGQAPDQNRSAFRLCVATSDLDKVLDSTAWPDYITISEWFYMDPADHSSRREKRTRYNSPPVDQPAAGIAGRRSPIRTDEHDALDDMETTVIYTGASSEPGIETSVKSAEVENTPENGDGKSP